MPPQVHRTELAETTYIFLQGLLLMPAPAHKKPLFTEYPRPSRQDCIFYHSFDLAEEEIIGQWDLRDHAEQYLGGIDLNNISVLEVGPAHPITHKSPPPKLQPIWVSTQGDGGGTGR